MKNKISFLSLLLAVMAIGIPLHSEAQVKNPASYALLSLAGDQISMVTFGAETGSRIDQNHKNITEVKTPVFDEATVQAANAVIKKIQPSVTTVMLITPDQGLYQAQNKMFDAPESNVENRTFLKSLLKDRPVTHLILITKYHSDARIQVGREAVGNGKIEGLGFYMDNVLEVLNQTTLNSGKGILAPFAYIKVRLLDAKTLELVREVTATESISIGNYKPEETGFAAWNILSSSEKVTHLQKLLGLAMEHTIPKLLLDTQ
jgi:hypothetical protein